MEASVITKEIMGYEEFVAHKAEIHRKLSKALESVLEDDSFGDDGPPESIRIGMPVVDSKAVMKISPDVEEIIGTQISTKWVKQGGYNSIKEAIDTLLTGIDGKLNIQE